MKDIWSLISYLYHISHSNSHLIHMSAGYTVIHVHLSGSSSSIFSPRSKDFLVAYIYIYMYKYMYTHTHTTSIFVSQCITPHCCLYIPWIYPDPIPIPPRYPHYTTNKMLLRSPCKSCSIPRPHSNSCPKSPLTINIPIHIPLTSY